jgi:hypothetical protein
MVIQLSKKHYVNKDCLGHLTLQLFCLTFVEALSCVAALQKRKPLHIPVAALNIELRCNIYCLFSLSLKFWRVKCMGVMN